MGIKICAYRNIYKSHIYASQTMMPIAHAHHRHISDSTLVQMIYFLSSFLNVMSLCNMSLCKSKGFRITCIETFKYWRDLSVGFCRSVYIGGYYCIARKYIASISFIPDEGNYFSPILTKYDEISPLHINQTQLTDASSSCPHWCFPQALLLHSQIVASCPVQDTFVSQIFPVRFP